MKTIYFIRHGETEANAGAVYLGKDDPLTERGRQQAQFIAKRCAKLPLEAIMASSMKRAQDTASYIAAETGLSMETSDEFVERLTPSDLIGKPYSVAPGKQLFQNWTESIISNGPRVLDGENFDDIKARTERALDLLLKRSESQIAVVTHSFFLRAIVTRVVFGPDFTPEHLKHLVLGFRTNNTGITVIQTVDSDDYWSHWMTGRDWILRVWNDRAHLG